MTFRVLWSSRLAYVTSLDVAFNVVVVFLDELLAGHLNHFNDAVLSPDMAFEVALVRKRAVFAAGLRADEDAGRGLLGGHVCLAGAGNGVGRKRRCRDLDWTRKLKFAWR